MLKAQGFVREAGRRGLSVAPLDPKLFDAICPFRSAVEPLAVTLAAAHIDQRTAQEGRALIASGKAAAARKDSKSLIAVDMAFHSFIEGPYGSEPKVLEAVALLPAFDGNYAVLGSWWDGGAPASLSVRESSGWISTNSSRFLPHAIV